MQERKLGPTLKQMLKLEGNVEGTKNCLRCDIEFYSKDIKGNRLCTGCRNFNKDKHFVLYKVGGLR